MKHWLFVIVEGDDKELSCVVTQHEDFKASLVVEREVLAADR